MAKRFSEVDDDFLNHMSQRKFAKRTEYSTHSASHSFNQFLVEHFPNINLKEIEEKELADIIERFYLSLKTKTGENYKISSLTQIKYNLRRYLQQEVNIDIIKNENFQECAIVFNNIVVELKREGKDLINHHPDINEEDRKMVVQKLSLEDPQQLQWLVFFYLMLYFCRRGCENLLSMKKDHFIVKIISSKSVSYFRLFVAAS